MTSVLNSKKNGLFIVIDALRYDTLESPEARKFLFPALSRFIEQSRVTKLTTNAQATQFVMPALFSQTYPLDYGGYNNGIKDRPASYAEVIHAAGYSTALYSACNQLGVGLGYERGFDVCATALDYRLLIEHRISRFLDYHIKAMRAGRQSREDILSIIQEEWGRLLGGIRENYENAEKAAWSAALARHNRRVAQGVDAEAALVQRNPEAVLAKLEAVPAGIYWHFLGDETVNRVSLFNKRTIESVRWRSRRWLNRRRFPPIILLSHFEAIAPEILGPVLERLRSGKLGSPWHMHIHLMDVHDARAINRIGNFMARMRFLPRWFRARTRRLTRRHWIYDTALMYVDRQLGELFELLEKSGEMANTCVVITGDHGNSFALSPRKKAGISTRTYREDIEVPLAVHAPWMDAPKPVGQYDSMSVSATILEGMGLQAAESFRGRSVFEPGKVAIVSESAGSGNADVGTRDLHFTVTGDQYKLIAVLNGNRLTVEKLFDLHKDPDEQTNLAGEPERKPAAESLVTYLMYERAELLKERGVDLKVPDWQMAA